MDRVAYRDQSADKDVGIEVAAADELLDDAGPCQLLQMQARLAAPDPKAFNVPQPESLADQIIEPNTADEHLTTRLSACQPDVLERFRLHQRERRAGPGALEMEMPISLQPLSGERPDGIDAHDRVTWPDIDGFYFHKAIIVADADQSNPISPRPSRPEQ